MNDDKKETKEKKEKKEKKETLLNHLRKAEETLLKRYQATRYENWRVAHLCIKQCNDQIEKAILYEKQIIEKRRQLAESANELGDFGE